MNPNDCIHCEGWLCSRCRPPVGEQQDPEAHELGGLRAQIRELNAKLDETHAHRCSKCEATVTEGTARRQEAEAAELDRLKARVLELEEQLSEPGYVDDLRGIAQDVHRLIPAEQWRAWAEAGHEYELVLPDAVAEYLRISITKEREACLKGIEALFCSDSACNHVRCDTLDEAAATVRARGGVQ